MSAPETASKEFPVSRPSDESPVRPRVLLAGCVSGEMPSVGDALAEIHDIIYADDWESASASVRRSRPDLVICDNPVLIRSFKEDLSARGIPIMALNGANPDESLAAGADDYLTTPLQAHDLITRAQLHIRRHRQMRESAARESLLLREVEKADERLRVVLMALDEHLAIYDADWRYVYVNDSAAEMLGKRKEELLGQCIWDLFPNSVGNQYYRELHQAAADRVTIHSEHYYAHDDRWFENHIYPLSTGVAVLARDITERKKADVEVSVIRERLEQELNGLMKLHEFSMHLVQQGNLDDLLREVLKAAIIITKSDMGVIQLACGDGRLELKAHNGLSDEAVRCLEQVAPGDAVCYAVARSGHRIVVDDLRSDPMFCTDRQVPLFELADAKSAQGTPLVSRSGKLLGVFSTLYRQTRRPTEQELRLLDLLALQATDLIEKRQAESALRESEERFRNMADHAPVMVRLTDASGDCVYLNRLWYEFTGTAPSETDRGHWLDALHPEDREPLSEILRQSLQSHKGFRTEYRLRRADGEWRWALCAASPRFSEQGEFLGFISSVIDISERKEMEDALQRANADLREFGYAAAHDLQEPLRNVSIFSELLESRYHDALSGDGLFFLKYVTEGARRMQALVTDLLQYTVLTDESVRLESVDTAVSARKAMDNLMDSIQSSGAVIEIHELPVVQAHAGRMVQLFQNLLSNALKYSRPDVPPHIEIRAERHGEEWRFSVKDNGIGIAPAHQNYIFGLFKRLHRGSVPGTGIGLAICRRIVEQYGGRIWVESEGQGKGSTLRFAISA